MSRRMRTYFYAILGALGGLFGWQVSDQLGLSFVSNLYLGEAVVGALVGLCIGLFIGLTEGLITRNLVQALRSGLFSGLLGLIAGAIGLPLGEFLFQSVGAGILGRALGWGVFGLLIGLAEGVVGKSSDLEGYARRSDRRRAWRCPGRVCTQPSQGSRCWARPPGLFCWVPPLVRSSR